MTGARESGGFLVAAAAMVMWAGAVLAQPACPGETAEAEAAEIVDARAVRLDDGRVLRLAGIEPFDILLPEATDAEVRLRERLGELVGSKMLRFQLVSRGPDRYGRLAAIVWAGDALLQEAAVRDGLAIAFATGDALPCFDRLLAAEETARGDEHGFWKGRRIAAALPQALAARIGRFAIFEGRIESVGNRRFRTYLNFGTWWAEDVTVEIAAKDRERFGGEAMLAALAGRKVRVRGFLEEKGGPLAVIASPMQLEVLEADDGTEQGYESGLTEVGDRRLER